MNVLRMRLLQGLWLLLLCACARPELGTEIVVVVDASADLRAQLTRLEVKVLERDGVGEPLELRELSLNAYSLPLSFSLAPSAQRDARDFRLLVTGFGRVAAETSERALVERQVISRFQPGRALRLELVFEQACRAVLCRDAQGQPGDLTCSELGTCAAVPELTDLDPARGPGLAGYEARDPALDAASGSAPDGGGPSDMCPSDRCTGMEAHICDPQSGRCVCDDRCAAPQLTRCSGGTVSVCRAGPSGCLDWQPLTTCATGCGDATSCAGCVNTCTEPGRGECLGNTVKLCQADAQGCLSLGESVSCADSSACTEDSCDPGLGRCRHAANDALCTAHTGNPCFRDYCDVATGCASMQTTVSCNDGMACTRNDVCTSGVCAGTLDMQMSGCADLCPNDAQKTAPGSCGCGVAEQTADKDKDGMIDCLDACPDDQCATVGVSCSASQLRTCSMNASGCRSQTMRACSNDLCMDASHCAALTVRSWGAGELVKPRAITSDAQGNLYVGGTAESALPGNMFGGTGDAFFTKWSPSGQRLFSAQWGTSQFESVAAIAVNGAGTRVALGGYNGTGGEAWVGVWSATAAGAALWRVSFPVNSSGPSAVQGFTNGVVFGPGGDVYAAGLNGGPLPGQTHNGDDDAFLMRLNATTGATVWIRQWGTANYDSVYALATEGTSLYATGVRGAVAGFGQDTETGDAFLRKYDASGTLTWERIIDNGRRDWAIGMALDASGTAIIVGQSFRNTGGNGLLARITSANVLQWQRHLEGQAAEQNSSWWVALDAAGNSYISIPNGTLYKNDASGAPQWTYRIPSLGSTNGIIASSVSGTLQVMTVGNEGAGATKPHVTVLSPE